MQFLTDAVRRLDEFSPLCEDFSAGRTPLAVFGVSHIPRLAVAMALTESQNGKAAFLVADESEAIKTAEDLAAMGYRVLHYPARDYSPEAAVRSPEYEHTRIGTLSNLLDGAFDMLIFTPLAATGRTLSPSRLRQLRFTVSAGEELPIGTLTEQLIEAGYLRAEKVEGSGQFAVRGNIVDIFTPNTPGPVRLDYWGDEVDSIAYFEPDSQRRTETADSVTVVPAVEVAIPDRQRFADCLEDKAAKAKDKRKEWLNKTAEAVRAGLMVHTDALLDELFEGYHTLLDYVDIPLFVCDSARVFDTVKGVAETEAEDLTLRAAEGSADKNTKPFHLSVGQLTSVLEIKKTVYLENMPRGKYETTVKGVYSVTAKRVSAAATVAMIAEDIPKGNRGLTVVLAGEPRTADSITAGLCDLGIKANRTEPNAIGKKGIFVTTGILSGGLEFPTVSFTLIPYGRATAPVRKRRFKKGGDIGSLDELRKGDVVVHSVHGIGIFDGIHPITTKGITSDYMRIRYHGTDALYVPVTSLDLVSRYIGGGDADSVKLNRLGSQEWQKTRARVRKAVKDIAKELTSLYAKRLKMKGYAFAPDCDLQQDFESRFPYEETADQLRAVAEIKKDMESSVPMDRLLCGDVGFGKTEVALRAAFKCIAEGKQCAVLVPTTILAWQHYSTATERLSGLPVTVEMLSRFRTAKQQTKIKKQLAAGNIDLIIGTHRLISNDVPFKDLGLLIIDEEQRFGVAQKEKLKERYPNVDVLTLSATPIPRTLNMALSGLRDMSAIEEAPHDRLPVQTYVMEQSKAVTHAAIAKELGRGGQVYYLHNRVDDITRVAGRLSEEFPEATVAVAHGKMSEEELSDVWQRLLEGEIQILVCTTIIETGVDVPNVNTLIIEEADRYGLSQLHQLRGRVGRSHRRAYAYFLFRAGKALSDISQKRLEAIRDFTAFGSGYRIAMRDLELRGAGSVLGGEQHGHMESVGYDMYIKMLGDAVAEENGERPTAERDCSLDIRSAARIPDGYITDLSQRLEMYRRIASIRSEEDRLDVTDELLDRFGEPPKPTLDLMEVALLKARCITLGFTDVSERNGSLVFTRADLPQEMLLALYAEYAARLITANGEKCQLAVKLKPNEKPLALLAEALDVMENIKN